jgi:hypothetical protein
MDIVTGADFRVIVRLEGGRNYTLAAPSFGQVGRFVEASASKMRPRPAVIMEEVREALRRLGRDDQISVVDEYEEADGHFHALLVSFSGDVPEAREQIAQARERKMRAERAQARVEWLVREDADLLAMRAAEGRLGREEHLSLLEVCLKTWEGEGLPLPPEGDLTAAFIAEKFPAGDVAVLGARAMGLMQPTKEAAGN